MSVLRSAPRSHALLITWMLVGCLVGPAGSEAPANPIQAPDSAASGSAPAPVDDPMDAAPEPVDDPMDAAPEPTDASQKMVIPSASGIGGPSKGIDALLKLPSGYGTRSTAQSVAGADESEWRRRFRESLSAIENARTGLAKTKAALDGAAESSGGTQWNVAPPTGGGGSPSQGTSPLSFKLRQELRTHRRELEAAERRFRELEIEANLAGVPKDWRGTPPAADETPPEVGQLLD